MVDSVMVNFGTMIFSSGTTHSGTIDFAMMISDASGYGMITSVMTDTITMVFI